MDDGLDFVKLSQRDLAARPDVLAGIAIIHPAVGADVRLQDDVRLPPVRLGHPDLRAVDAVHEDFQDVAAREIIHMLVERQEFFRQPARSTEAKPIWVYARRPSCHPETLQWPGPHILVLWISRDSTQKHWRDIKRVRAYSR